MTERLFHYIWQFQYFHHTDLTTDQGEKVEVLFPGNYNANQGPDFLNARIQIDQNTWIGTVELHLKTSDWQKHGHTSDQNYKNVVLHVVWDHDTAPGNIPVLELKNRVSKILIGRYEELMKSSCFIPCEKMIAAVPALTWNAWKERIVIERLQRKSRTINLYLQHNCFHWEEACWWIIARNFGIKVNADAFEAIARSLPLSLLGKHRENLFQLEALLLGQGGLLAQDFEDKYAQNLRKEYEFLKNKYRLKPIPIPLHYLRMRPGNFPTIRLAQLARFVHQSDRHFSRMRDTETIAAIRKWLQVSAGKFWNQHYTLSSTSPPSVKKLGSRMIDSLVINSVVPLLFAYSEFHKDDALHHKALSWLEQTPGEVNHVTNGFQRIGVGSKTSFDSQALLELKQEYCERKRCLECAIGNCLIKG